MNKKTLSKQQMEGMKQEAKEFLKKNAILWLKSRKQKIERKDLFPGVNPNTLVAPRYYISDWGEIMLIDRETEAMVEIMKKETFMELYGDWFNGPMFRDKDYPLPNNFNPNDN